MIKRTISACLVVMALVMSTLAAVLYDQTTTEADARLVSVEGLPHDAGFILTRTWPGLAVKAASGDTIDDLFIALNAVTNYSNPKANNQTYSGSFVNSETRAIDDDPPGRSERMGIIIQTLTKIKTTVTLAGLGVADPAATEELLNFLELEEGDKSLRFKTYRNLDARKMEAWLDVTVTQSGHKLVRRDFKVEANKTGTMTFTFETNTWKGDTSSEIISTNIITEINVSGIQRRQEKGSDGVKKDNVFAVRDNLTPTSGWTEDRIDVSEKPNGEYDIRMLETKQRGTGDQIATQFTPSQGRLSETEWFHWFNLTSANSTLIFNDAKSNASDMTLATYRTAPAGHKLKTVRQIPNPNGSFDIDRVTFIPINSSSATWPETTAGGSSNTIYIQLSKNTRVAGQAAFARYVFGTKTVLYTNTYAAAWARIPLTVGGVNRVYSKGTGVTRIGDGKYKATIILRVLDNSANFRIGLDTEDYKSNVEEVH